MDPPDGQNPVLDSGGSQQKGARSVFQGGGSQITGGGSESWGGGAEIRRNPPNLTPGFNIENFPVAGRNDNNPTRAFILFNSHEIRNKCRNKI